MKIRSNITGKIYEQENVRFIPNMQQNYKYLQSGKAYDDLVDVICGNNDKIVFVWAKSETMNELYHLWCENRL